MLLRAIVLGGVLAPAMLRGKHVFRVLRSKPLARRTDCPHDACEAPGKELAPQQCQQTVLLAITGVVRCGPKSLAAKGCENQ